MHILINNKFLNFNNYKAKCVVGKRGIGYKKKEGDLITPKGLYRIKCVLYRKDRIKKMSPDEIKEEFGEKGDKFALIRAKDIAIKENLKLKQELGLTPSGTSKLGRGRETRCD